MEGIGVGFEFVMKSIFSTLTFHFYSPQLTSQPLKNCLCYMNITGIICFCWTKKLILYNAGSSDEKSDFLSTLTAPSRRM